MHKTLPELKDIAAAIGYQIVESAESPDSFYLIRRVEHDARIDAGVELETPGPTSYTLEELSETLGLAIEKSVAALIREIRKHYQDLSEIKVDDRLVHVADLVDQRTAGSRSFTKPTILQLARDLHELAMELCHRRGKGSSES